MLPAISLILFGVHKYSFLQMLVKGSIRIVGLGIILDVRLKPLDILRKEHVGHVIIPGSCIVRSYPQDQFEILVRIHAYEMVGGRNATPQVTEFGIGLDGLVIPKETPHLTGFFPIPPGFFHFGNILTGNLVGAPGQVGPDQAHHHRRTAETDANARIERLVLRMCHISHLVIDVAVQGYDVWNPVTLVIRSHEGHDPALGIIEKFIQQLESTLYQTHTEFASNPLLLTIMLMTFEQFAEVPSKMHVFYREAYATLSQKHDASKGAYKRALKTGLSADHKDITECFNKLNIRKKDEDLKFTSDDFIYDLQNNLCLLYYESGKYHFTHRSFQEYFCALYFSKQKDKALERIGESFEHRKYQSNSDKTFSMLYDMIPDKVEEYIFLPYLQKVFDKCSGPNGYWQYLTKYVKFVIAGPMHHYLRDAEVKNQLLLRQLNVSRLFDFFVSRKGRVVKV